MPPHPCTTAGHAARARKNTKQEGKLPSFCMPFPRPLPAQKGEMLKESSSSGQTRSGRVRLGLSSNKLMAATVTYPKLLTFSYQIVLTT